MNSLEKWMMGYCELLRQHQLLAFARGDEVPRATERFKRNWAAFWAAEARRIMCSVLFTTSMFAIGGFFVVQDVLRGSWVFPLLMTPPILWGLYNNRRLLKHYFNARATMYDPPPCPLIPHDPD